MYIHTISSPAMGHGQPEGVPIHFTVPFIVMPSTVTTTKSFRLGCHSGYNWDCRSVSGAPKEFGNCL